MAKLHVAGRPTAPTVFCHHSATMTNSIARDPNSQLAAAPKRRKVPGGSTGLTLTSTLHTISSRFDSALSLGTGKMAKNVACKYRITATVKADTKYELEAIKARLIRAGATILHIDPITSVTAERPDPPTNFDGQRLGDYLFGRKH
jgi:hypothetical protein